jgi:hypothetical protein
MFVLAAWCLLVWTTTSHLYAILCIGVTWLILKQGNRLIRREAPSSEAYYKALQQCSDRRLPVWILVATIIMCRKFLPPVSHSIDWVPMAHFAIASGVLSLVIASRYIGPASIGMYSMLMYPFKVLSLEAYFNQTLLSHNSSEYLSMYLFVIIALLFVAIYYFGKQQ